MRLGIPASLALGTIALTTGCKKPNSQEIYSWLIQNKAEEASEFTKTQVAEATEYKEVPPWPGDLVPEETNYQNPKKNQPKTLVFHFPAYTDEPKTELPPYPEEDSILESSVKMRPNPNYKLSKSLREKSESISKKQQYALTINGINFAFSINNRTQEIYNIGIVQENEQGEIMVTPFKNLSETEKTALFSPENQALFKKKLNRTLKHVFPIPNTNQIESVLEEMLAPMN